MGHQRCCILLGLMILTLAVQANEDWELIKQEEGVKVYSKLNGSSQYIEIKAVSSTKSSLASFVALMNDVGNFQNWMHATKEAKLIERTGPYGFIYYLHSDLPWPAQDRDVVLKLSIHQDQSTGAVYTKSTNIKGRISEKEGIHRICSVETSWRFIPLTEKTVRIVFHTRVIPKVHLPDWLAREIYHIGPYHTINKMKTLITRDKYQDARVNMDQLVK